jgi:heme acquisition protein HasA
VVISGLDISSTYSEGHSGLVHELVYSLIEGDTSVLLGILDEWLASYELSTDSTFAELEDAGLASQFGTTGTASSSESELSLAA